MLFAFDPMARGHVPVERFQEAAERYGYVVMGSNNSRNGPVRVELEAIRAMWTDAKRRFHIDESRAYAAGFSGGARAACQMGLMLKGMAGVIAVGGGFPLEARPSPEVAFALYGVAGEADLNFNEMLRLDRDLEALRIAHHFEVLTGGHEWPSSAVCREALEWMELQAMRADKRERDPALIALLLAARLSKVQAQEENGRLAAAFRAGEEAVRDFQGLTDLREVESRVARLKASLQLAKTLKNAAKREKRLEQQDDLLAWRVTQVLSRILSTERASLTRGRSGPVAGEPTDSMVLERLVADLGISRLRRTIEAKPGTDAAILAERQRDRIFISTFENARTLIDAEKYAQAVMCLEIAAQVEPESPFAAFNLARALALDKQKDRAIKALASAAEKGFDRLELIEKEAAFDFLRSDPQFSTVLEKVRARANPQRSSLGGPWCPGGALMAFPRHAPQGCGTGVGIFFEEGLDKG